MDKDNKLIFEAYNYKKAMQSDKARVKKKGIGGAMDAATQRLKQSIKDEPLNWIEKNRFKTAQGMTENEEDNTEGMDGVVSKYSDPKPITNYAIKQLYKMLDELGQLSTAIQVSHQPEIDQVLSKIRDLADMLIAD